MAGVTRVEKAINPVMGGGAEREGRGEVERWETLAGWEREGCYEGEHFAATKQPQQHTNFDADQPD